MKKVLWISDEPGWAYDVNAKALATQMPQYEHHFIYTVSTNREQADLITPKMDIIVAMNPLSFYMYSDFHKVISVLDSMRALTDSDKSKLSQVSGIICTNKMLFDKASKYNQNVIMQTNGVDLEYYKPDYSKQSNIFTFGFAGNISGAYSIYKGWNVYQAAIKELLNEVAQFNVIYGVNQLSADKMVSEFYNKIHCLILLSDGEGCSNVVTEALACGIPVIITKVGFHSHALIDGKQGFLVEKNIREVQERMIWMSKDKELYERMKKEAREFAVQNHDITKVAKKYAEIFEVV